MRAALRANRLPAKALYLTTRQAGLWRAVALAHSPIQRDPAFGRIYDEAFARMAGQGGELVGVGAGTGEKEARLARQLAAGGRAVRFAGIDASEDLVREAAERLAAFGVTHRRSLVCDLAEITAWRGWLEEHGSPEPRLITFFGLVPNFAPSELGPILRGFCGPAISCSRASTSRRTRAKPRCALFSPSTTTRRPSRGWPRQSQPRT